MTDTGDGSVWVRGVLHDWASAGDRLRLRLDRYEWDEARRVLPETMRVVDLYGCDAVPDELPPALERFRGELFSAEIAGVPSGFTVGLACSDDYGADPDWVLTAADVQIADLPLTADDLRREREWLQARIDRAEAWHAETQDELRRLRGAVESVLTFLHDEAERTRRKTEFFDGTNPLRAAEMGGQSEAYRRIDRVLRLALDERTRP